MQNIIIPSPPFQPNTDGYMIIIDPVLYNIVPVYNDTQTLKNIRSSLGYNFVINQDKTEPLKVKKDRLYVEFTSLIPICLKHRK